MLFAHHNAPNIPSGKFRGLEQVVNVRSHDSALRIDLNFQVGSQAHRIPKTVAASALEELRPAGRVIVSAMRRASIVLRCEP